MCVSDILRIKLIVCVLQELVLAVVLCRYALSTEYWAVQNQWLFEVRQQQRYPILITVQCSHRLGLK